MAKKITAVVKLQLPAGKATPAPPVGSTLGPHGINIPGFTKEFNAKDRASGRTYHSLRSDDLSGQKLYFRSQNAPYARTHQKGAGS